ncbi:LLM class flavin-dependent oxidoreductase [Ornithinimicrobium sp. INDO-MA30-4]|nr:LLM class flavin-dependent oxidoreductase [Ornithinimicrobium sp. INDO-MA30-4]UJH70115.1 LLM class flavin-dependent oxidoreductase [Ornithinimicrobium sp. INDO-MA30-4]
MTLSPSSDPLKFAYWVPNVSGGLVVSTIEQRTNHTPDYNIETAQIAEQVGFDYALTQVRYLASYGADAQHESVSFSLGLLSKTEKLKVIAAVHPGQWPPTILAKLGATAQELHDNRLCLNVVSGWFKDEYTKLGLPWLDHEERYRRAEEFIDVLRGLWAEDDFTYRGDFYRTRDVTFRPAPKFAPEIFQGGNSTSARAMASRVSDWYFMNGGSIEKTAEQIQDVGAQAATNGRDIKLASTASPWYATPKKKPLPWSKRSSPKLTSRRSTTSAPR